MECCGDRRRLGRGSGASSSEWVHRAHREEEPYSDTWDGRPCDSLRQREREGGIGEGRGRVGERKGEG